MLLRPTLRLGLQQGRNRMMLGTAALKPVQVPDILEIRLSQTEDDLCKLLDESVAWMAETKHLPTSCRIAGGWVRDKLLGSDSNDIDVALENVMGLDFAENFVDFAGSVKKLPVKSVSKVESNPDQSKHLETAKTKVLDTELDFVNLRSEEYAGESRIPTEVKFGTPLQDALRRDITINALFYNVHTREIEDHTGKGLEDLRTGVIRTPLPPKETFTDDPLRVIRCVRFASRFGFGMVEELREAASHPDIRAALVQKISRERVGEELHKMLKGRDPLGSIQLIHSLGIYLEIFLFPPVLVPQLSGAPAASDISLNAVGILASLLSPTDAQRTGFNVAPPLHQLLPPNASAAPRLYLASALTPYAGLTYSDNKGKTHAAVDAILRDGLKLGVQAHYSDGIPALFEAAKLLRNPDATKSRLEIGLLLREKAVHNPITGQHWTLSLLFSLVQELVPLVDAEHESGLVAPKATPIIEQYNTFVTRVEELGLISAIDAKPMLDGREVVAAFSARPGPWTGAVLARVVEWQLEHPQGTKEDCTAWLLAERDAGRIVTGTPSVPKRTKGEDTGSGKKVKRG